MPTKALCVRSLARTPNADPCAARTKPRKQNIQIQHHTNKNITHVPTTTTLYRYAAAHPLASTHIRKQLPKTNPHTRSAEHVGSSCWKQLLTVHRHSYSNDIAFTKQHKQSLRPIYNAIVTHGNEKVPKLLKPLDDRGKRVAMYM